MTIRQYGAEQLEVIVPEVEEREVDQIKKQISTSGKLQFRIVANEIDDKDLIKAGAANRRTDVYIGGSWRAAGSRPSPTCGCRSSGDLPPDERRGRKCWSASIRYNVDGRYLSRAMPDFDESGGRAVGFVFDSAGSEKFGQLTSKNLPDTATDFHRNLGIMLDDTMTRPRGSTTRFATTARSPAALPRSM